jgi:hypothetical protein
MVSVQKMVELFINSELQFEKEPHALDVSMKVTHEVLYN